jgi:acyl phosphate:glycerol-3-phosphate acyltransferase
MSHNTWLVVLLPVGAYLVGGIPFGLLVGHLRGIDVRKCGSGNIGATNVARVLGRRWGLLVFGLDVAKGAVPTAIATWLMGSYGARLGVESALWQTLVVIAVQACCVFGHNWSIYLGFKGGKGVATSLGILLGYWPYLTLPGLAGLLTWGLVLAASRYVSAASIVGAAAFPFYVATFGTWQGWPTSRTALLAGFSAVMASLIIVRHRANIGRLLAGTEPKIGQKVGANDKDQA